MLEEMEPWKTKHLAIHHHSQGPTLCPQHTRPRTKTVLHHLHLLHLLPHLCRLHYQHPILMKAPVLPPQLLAKMILWRIWQLMDQKIRLTDRGRAHDHHLALESAGG